MKQLLTNELKINLNMEIFRSKYKVDCFYKKEEYISRKDLLNEKKYNKILSILIRNGKIYILSMIEDKIDYQDLIQNGYKKIEDEISESIIFSLLLNSLSKTEDSDSKLSNILGSLFYFVRKSRNNLIFLNISFYGKHLNLNVNTFTNKLDKNDSVRFILKGNKLCYPAEGEKANYTKRNDDERSQVAFINVNPDDYSKCKSMIADEIINEMNVRFNDFLHVEFVSYDFESVKWSKTENIKLSIEKRVNEFKINIINSAKEEYCLAAENLKELLLYNCRINFIESSIEISNALKKDYLNINIVLPKEKYVDEDKYMISTLIPIQNIYCDTLAKEYEKTLKKSNYKSSVIEKIVMELLFKFDIIEKKANLLKVYNIDVPQWRFFIKRYIASNHKKYNGEVSVCNGELNISFKETIEEDKNKKEVYGIDTGEKIMFCNLDSNFYPLPNTKHLKQIMQENEKSAMIGFDVEEIKDIVKKFVKKNDEIIVLLNSFSRNSIYSSELREMFKSAERARAFSLVEKEYYTRHHSHIYINPLSSENKENIFCPCSDINYYMAKDNQGNDVVYYFVGKMEEVKKQKLDKGYTKWMPIKNIYNCSEEVFKKYLGLIENDILSVNKYSTKPVLFKYLIEAIETNVKLNKIRESNSW